DTVGRRSVPKQFFRNDSFIHERLIHRKYIGRLLRLIRAEATLRVKQSRRHIPSRSRFKAISRRVVGYFVITFGEIAQTLEYLFLGGAGGQSEERIGKITATVIELRWKVIGFRLSVLTHQCSILVVRMNVMRQRAHIV